MSDNTTSATIHREFELERMILFSDAVFAIAITLLVIEIKFPEIPDNYKQGLDLWLMFKPTVIQFMAFLISFFFIGMSWTRHLKMFRYLKAYDDGVIFRNLASLFFIVAFPFSASGMIHVNKFLFPMVIYFGNVALIFISNFMLAHYIFRKKPSLSMPGFEQEKKHIYLLNKTFAILVSAGFVIVLLTGMITHYDVKSVSVSMYIVCFAMIAMRRWLKKFKPKPVMVNHTATPDS